METVLSRYWRPLAIIIIVAFCALWVRSEIIDYGDQRYDAGYAKAITEQKEADKREEQRRDAEKQKIQADAQQRIDVARRDAVDAAIKSGKLQQQLATIRKQLVDYSRTESIGNPASSTGILLTDVLEKSIERNQQLAEYADAARESGLTCQRQYDSLRNKKAP
ncbi:DUF2514 protein [Citrobacter phage vB_CfrS_K1M]